MKENEDQKIERIAYMMRQGISKGTYYRKVNDTFFGSSFNLNTRNGLNKLKEEIQKYLELFPHREVSFIKEDSRFVIDPSKIVNYMLRPGSKHFAEFVNVGYLPNDYVTLFEDIAQGFDMNKAVFSSEKEFSIKMELGITKKLSFKTGWEIMDDGTIRLVTCYRNN